MSENKYINLVKTSLEVIKNSHVPLRSSKYSKKKYTQHQLLTLIILKEEIGMDYHDFSELLHILTPINEILKLKDIPHFTTIHKFLSRIPALIFCIILKNVIRNIHQKGKKSELHRLILRDLPVHMQVITIQKESTKLVKVLSRLQLPWIRLN